MKNLMKYSFLHTKYIIALIAVLAIVSCDDFLDVDTDTDNPTTAPIEQLLPAVIKGVNNTTEFRSWTGEVLAVYTHQFTAREEQDQYGAKASNFSIRNDWDNTYLTLSDIETLISSAKNENNKVYEGIAQILKAYLISTSVDLWGDIPFSEATKLEEGIVSPVFDDQVAIYQSVLELLDTGKANILSEEGLIMPSEDDLFYNGDLDKWVKFANTFKFKLYNQIRNTSLFNQADFNALVADNNFFISSADDFQFNYTSAESPTDERNKLYLASYGGTQVGHYLSPWFYEILKGMNPNIHTGNADPRLPYYFVNQLFKFRTSQSLCFIREIR